MAVSGDNLGLPLEMAGGFADGRCTEAKQICRCVLRTVVQKSAMADLLAAMRRGVAKSLVLACKHARAVGMSCHIVDESFAHTRQLYCHRLHAAVESRRLKQILTACSRAEAVGVDAGEIEMARNCARALCLQDLTGVSFYKTGENASKVGRNTWLRFAEACKFADIAAVARSHVREAQSSARRFCMIQLAEAERDVNVEHFFEVVWVIEKLALFPPVDMEDLQSRTRMMCLANLSKVSNESYNAYELGEALDLARHVGVNGSDLDDYVNELWDRIERDDEDMAADALDAEEAKAHLHAVRGCGCAEKLESACQEASGLCVPDELVEEILAEARRLRTQDISLARQICDAAEIEKACELAREADVPPSEIREAWMEAGQLHALADLSWARSSGSAQQIESACTFAERAGIALPPELVMEAKAEARLLCAQAELLAARQSGNCERIEEACRIAEVSGVAHDKVKEGRTDVKRLQAEASIENMLLADMSFLRIGEWDALCTELDKASGVVPPSRFALAKRALRRRSAEAELCSTFRVDCDKNAQRVFDHAEAFGATLDMVDAARSAARRCTQLEQRRFAYASDPVEVALLVGTTAHHNRLAGSLGKVLAQCEDNSGAMANLTDKDGSHQRLFDPRSSKIFSLDGDVDYGSRGGCIYFKPRGWLRYGVYFNPFTDSFAQYEDWPVAYHGTTKQNVLPILLQGLRRPGDVGAIVSTAHGAAYSKHGEAIYLSPSIEYAAFPVYAQLFPLDQKDHWAQLVFQCRVRPNSFKVYPGSLRNKYWKQSVRFDPNFDSMKGLEWLISDPADVVVTGLMVREFGSKADPIVYGHTPHQVHAGLHGPEFEWTNLREAEFERQGLVVNE